MEREKGIVKKIFDVIGKSIYDKKDGKVSSTRVSSYFILGGILTAVVTFIGIDVANAIIAIMNKGFYEVPSNHIILYGMTLAHHLALLGINKNAEHKVDVAVQDKMKSLNQLNPKDMPTTPPVERDFPEEG